MEAVQVFFLMQLFRKKEIEYIPIGGINFRNTTVKSFKYHPHSWVMHIGELLSLVESEKSNLNSAFTNLSHDTGESSVQPSEC